MKVYNNTPFSSEPEPWKTPGKWVIFYNQIDNGVQEDDNEGNRYEAELIVGDDLSEETIAAAKKLNEEHPEEMQKIIDGTI